MNGRTMLLALSTTALTALLGCASTPATRTEAPQEAKACSCAHKPQEGAAQAPEGQAACSCPHCAHTAKGGEGEATACGCSRGQENQVSTLHGDSHQG